jgi:hypothetical protein
MGTLFPNPPPTSGLTIRILCSGMPDTIENSVRWAWGACEVIVNALPLDDPLALARIDGYMNYHKIFFKY